MKLSFDTVLEVLSPPSQRVLDQWLEKKEYEYFKSNKIHSYYWDKDYEHYPSRGAITLSSAIEKN